MGDPGYSSGLGLDGDRDAAAAEWWDQENELLSAPKRSTGLAVNYQRSAKQVRVRVLPTFRNASTVTWATAGCVAPNEAE